MEYQADWNLGSIPEELLRSEWSRRLSRRRKKLSGGRKPRMHRCPFCNELFALAVLRSHTSVCRFEQLQNFAARRQRVVLVLGDKFVGGRFLRVNRRTVTFRPLQHPDSIAISITMFIDITKRRKQLVSIGSHNIQIKLSSAIPTGERRALYPRLMADIP